MKSFLRKINHREKLPFEVSFLLHAVVFSLAIFDWSNASTDPKGVNLRGNQTVIEITSNNELPIHQKTVTKNYVTPPKNKSKDALIKSSEKITANENSTLQDSQFGLVDGKQTSGKVGHANGYEASAKQRYIYELRMLIEGRKSYPSISKRFRETGSVKVRFSVKANGEISNVEIVQGSHHTRLNEAAIQLISSLQKYRPFPQDMTVASLQLELPIEYSLN